MIKWLLKGFALRGLSIGEDVTKRKKGYFETELPSILKNVTYKKLVTTLPIFRKKLPEFACNTSKLAAYRVTCCHSALTNSHRMNPKLFRHEKRHFVRTRHPPHLIFIGKSSARNMLERWIWGAHLNINGKIRRHNHFAVFGFEWGRRRGDQPRLSPWNWDSLSSGSSLLGTEAERF